MKFIRPLSGVVVVLACLSACAQLSSNTGAQVQIFQGSTQLTSGSGYNFGSEAQYAPASVTFTVKNVGSTSVTLDPRTPYSITGTNSADFSAQGSGLSLAPGSSTTFNSTFTPSILGGETATGTVNSDAGSFSFPLNGTGAASGGVQLAWGTNGSTFPNPITNGVTSVGYTHVYSSDGWPQVYYFQIKNTSPTAQLGVGSLTITTNTGSLFAVSGSPPSPAVPANGTETFAIEASAYLGVTKTYTETVALRTSSTNTPDQTFSFTVTDFQS